MNILIVGAGLYGAVCARELKLQGHSCHVIEKRNHIGGNIYTQFSEEAQCHEHVYGAHIFHTNSDRIWNYIKQFADFNHFTNRVKVRHKESIYSFPINLMTLYQVYGSINPHDAQAKLKQDLIEFKNPQNMEEFCLANIGRKLYEIFIEGYTQKQWGIHPSKLPADIIKRIPFRLNFDDNYFNDKYQGIPIGGYTKIIEKMLDGIKVDLNIDFFSDQEYWLNKYDRIIYTGEIDRFFHHKFGILQYRSLRFERELIKCNDWQGNAVINYTDSNINYTRILEHKHFDLQLNSPYTVITREYPDAWTTEKIPFYPINDDRNNALFELYRAESEKLPHVHFGGRLGSFRYFDMHQVIGAALSFCDKFDQ